MSTHALNAAIYARKSTEQTGVPDEAKSVTRQVEHAEAYATRKGWSVAAEHVYIDDGISGAEFARRPGLMRLLNALKPRPPFDVLVLADSSRLGREMTRTSYTLLKIIEAGVQVWFYLEDKQAELSTPTAKVMQSLTGFADEMVRDRARQHTKDAHMRKMLAGFVVGGRVFGYRNEHVYSGTDAHGNPLRSGTRRVIDPEQAGVVQQIFEWYSAGLGLKAIAKRLTATRTPGPKPKIRTDGLTPPGWSPSSIRVILARELYRGVVLWNRSRKRNDVGQIHKRPRPTEEWTRVVDESLRIVSDDLWKRVASRRADTAGRTLRFESGRLCGRPPKHAVQNLLAGLATCGVCGGGLLVDVKRGVGQYLCQRYRNGTCTNTLRMPVEDMNEAVLQAVEEHVFTPEAIEQVIALTERDELRERQDALHLEHKDVERRIARLTAVLESDEGAGIASIVAKLRLLEQRKVALTRELETCMPVPRLPPSVVQNRLDEWRQLLRASTTQGRAVLQRVIRGRITFTPTEAVIYSLDANGDPAVYPRQPGYEFEAPTRFDKLFSGHTIKLPASGRYPGDIPHHTFCEDADYGALLERACGGQKGVTTPTGILCPSLNPLALAAKGMAYPAPDPQPTAIGHLSPNNTQIATGRRW